MIITQLIRQDRYCTASVGSVMNQKMRRGSLRTTSSKEGVNLLPSSTSLTTDGYRWCDDLSANRFRYKPLRRPLIRWVLSEHSASFLKYVPGVTNSRGWNTTRSTGGWEILRTMKYGRVTYRFLENLSKKNTFCVIKIITWFDTRRDEIKRRGMYCTNNPPSFKLMFEHQVTVEARNIFKILDLRVCPQLWHSTDETRRHQTSINPEITG